MKLPAGTDGGIITNPQDESAVRQLMAFRGTVEIDTQLGHGFMLTDHGVLIAVYFKDMSGSFKGKAAFTLHSYTDDEFRNAVAICEEEGFLLAEPKKGAVSRPPQFLDETKLKKILTLPGVIAISCFFEGFSVQSFGDADFEHVAALGEDLLRAGIKITKEMEIGCLDQLILETATKKMIIAPCGDLFLCVFTEKDTQLGLLRVAIKNLQSDMHNGT
jgi:predicted regulator of Ras-like GTPase activity (Roadblock/LC7/MglB family)